MDLRAFESRHALAAIGDRIGGRRIGDEKALETFLHNSVEDPVRIIIEQFKKVGATTDVLKLGDGVIFDNHPHAISDVTQGIASDEEPTTPPQTPAWHQRQGHTTQLRADQICVYRSQDDAS